MHVDVADRQRSRDGKVRAVVDVDPRAALLVSESRTVGRILDDAVRSPINYDVTFPSTHQRRLPFVIKGIRSPIRGLQNRSRLELDRDRAAGGSAAQNIYSGASGGAIVSSADMEGRSGLPIS